MVFKGISWQTDFKGEALAEEVLKNFKASLDSEECKRIKKTTGRRSIYRLRTRSPELPEYLFIKVLTRPPMVKRMKYIFRPSRTRQEWRMARIFRELGLPAAQPLAVGEAKKLGLIDFTAIILECLEGYKPLDKYFHEKFSGEERQQERREFIRRLAGLVRRLHDLGIVQRDFKPDSIMIGGKGQGLDFRFVDLERAKYFKGELKRRERIKNLANIFQTFELLFSREDYKDFLECYFEKDGISGDELNRINLEISGLAEKLARRWACKLRSWVRTENELYYNFRHGAWRVYAHESMHEDGLRKLLDEGNAINEGREFSILRKREREPSRLVIRESRPGFDTRRRSFIGGALFGFENATVLRHRGIPYVKVRAAVEKRIFGRWRKGFIIMERPCRFADIKDEWRRLKPDEEKAQMFLERMGKLIRRLETIGFEASVTLDRVINVYVRDDAESEFFIDHPEKLYFARGGKSTSSMDLVSEVAAMLELEKNEKDLMGLYPASVRTEDHD